MAGVAREGWVTQESMRQEGPAVQRREVGVRGGPMRAERESFEYEHTRSSALERPGGCS